MSIPTISWNENQPAGSEAKALGDNRIRELKQQIREIMEVDHFMESSGQHNDWGKHEKVSLIEQTDLGTGEAGKPLLGAQPDENGSTKSELVFVDTDDNDIQITRDGYLNLSVGRYQNNENIVARSADGLSLYPLIKLTAANKVQVPDGAILATSDAPTEDAGIANKKYVDDQIAVVSGSLLGVVSIGTAQTISGAKEFSAEIMATGGINLNAGTIRNGLMARTSLGEITITTDSVARYVPAGAYVVGGFKQSDGNFTKLLYAYL